MTRNGSRKKYQMVEEDGRYFKDRACLIAVGVMHLPGDKGLISLLLDKGYVVQPVR